MTLRILITTHAGDVAGSTNSISYLSAGLARRGHEIHVGCRRESLLWTLLEGTPVNRIPMTFPSKFDPENIRQIRDAVRKHRIGIINAQDGKDRYTTILSKWLYHLPVQIVHTRRQTPMSAGVFFQNWFYTKGTYKIVAVSHQIKHHLAKMGIPDDHIEVIYNGTPPDKYNTIDPSHIETLRRRFELSDTDAVIGCVSRNKRQEQLLSALCAVKQPLVVLMVGAFDRPEYQQIISRFPVPHRVVFTGFVDGRDALHSYLLCRMNILPSVTEGLSQSLLEAMALGVPVIATNAAGNIDLVKHEVNGLLFDDGDIPTLTRHIDRLLSDATLCRKLVENGRRTALQDFSIENTLDGYERFFSSIPQL